MDEIHIDAAMLARLKVAYGNAVRERREIVIVDGHEFVTKYLRYLIRYGEQRLKV